MTSKELSDEAMKNTNQVAFWKNAEIILIPNPKGIQTLHFIDPSTITPDLVLNL